MVLIPIQKNFGVFPLHLNAISDENMKLFLLLIFMVMLQVLPNWVSAQKSDVGISFGANLFFGDLGGVTPSVVHSF